MTHHTPSDLLSRRLPKWPQMVVTGQPVTVDQAKEIIRRTDLFFVMGRGGNDREYIARVQAALGMPTEPDWARTQPALAEITAYHEAQDEWQKRWGVVPTSYVWNEWISTSNVGGPYGWVHPDGTIGSDGNVGKWPSIEDVLLDWRGIAEEFPFLELGITLMDREHCEEGAQPVVSMRVRGGTVELLDPSANVHVGHAPVAPVDVEEHFQRMVRREPGVEQGLPWEWIEGWATKMREVQP